MYIFLLNILKRCLTFSLGSIWKFIFMSHLRKLSKFIVSSLYEKKKTGIPAGRSELASFLHGLTVPLLKMNLDVRHAPGTEPKHHGVLSANAFNTV